MRPVREELYKVGVPLGTRLAGLVRVRRNGVLMWQVWLGIANPAKDPSRWIGTYLLLGDDGSVTRVTEEEDRHDEFRIKAPDSN